MLGGGDSSNLRVYGLRAPVPDVSCRRMLWLFVLRGFGWAGCRTLPGPPSAGSGRLPAAPGGPPRLPTARVSGSCPRLVVPRSCDDTSGYRARADAVPGRHPAHGEGGAGMTGQAFWEEPAETHLRATPIELVLPFHVIGDLGEGHPAKRTLILRGGGAAIAKYAPAGEQDLLQQARNEVAAWRLLRALDWTDLGVTTVLREIQLEGEGTVLAAVQTALAGQTQHPCPGPETFAPRDALRAAVFDVLIGNNDREGNWFGLGEADPLRLKLYDHGHSFGLHGRAVRSAFVTQHDGDVLPRPVTKALQALTDTTLNALTDYLPQVAIHDIARRRDRLLQSNTFGPDDHEQQDPREP